MRVPSTEPLSPEEHRLLIALREIPDGPFRDLFTTLVSELTEFAQSPSCAEMQADGAPCTSADASCEKCRKVEQVLQGLRTRLQES